MILIRPIRYQPLLRHRALQTTVEERGYGPWSWAQKQARIYCL